MIRWLFLILCFAPQVIQAGAIKRINAPKQLILIDQGSEQGLEKKTRICFYDAGTRVGCGLVRSVKPKTAVVGIRNPKTFAKLKEGMEARVEPLAAAGSATAAGGASGAEAAGAAGPAGAKSSPSYVLFFGAFPAVNPVTYANILYKAPLNQAVSSLWEVESQVAATGGGLELGFGLGSTVLAVGARTRLYQPRKIAADYDQTDSDSNGKLERFAETVALGSSFGAYVDFHYLTWRWGFSELSISNGLDFDSSTVNFEMVQKNDLLPEENNPYYKASSKLTVLSLRTSASLDFRFSSLGIKLGTHLIVPLSQSPSFSAPEPSDPLVTNLQGKTPAEDLQEALAHKGQFGAEIFLAAYFSY